MLRVAFIDDEEEIVARMLGYIERYERENEVQFQKETYRDGMDILACNEFPDILFLDIEMKNLDGMKAAEEIRKRDEWCVIVFVTRMAQYAIEGYNVRALDFVVKPMTYETFAFKFRRAVDVASKRVRETITVSSHGGKHRLAVADIEYAEVIDHKVIYHMDGRAVEVWSSMKTVREQLEPYGFYPCSASYLVNLRKVRAFAGNDVYVGKDVLKISRNKRDEFLKELARYLC